MNAVIRNILRAALGAALMAAAVGASAHDGDRDWDHGWHRGWDHERHWHGGPPARVWGYAGGPVYYQSAPPPVVYERRVYVERPYYPQPYYTDPSVVIGVQIPPIVIPLR